MNGLNNEELYGKVYKTTHKPKKIYRKKNHQSKRSSKTAQKMIHGQTRASVRDWIKKANWDNERKIPCYEKSLAWYLD